MSQTKLGNQLKQTALDALEKEIIVGCLIGDGSLTKAGKHYRLRIEHAFKDKEYVDWKFGLLKRLCVSNVHSVSQHRSLRFGTIGHPEMTALRQVWYRPSKQIPSDFVLTPMMMAIWFMDDGTKHRDTVDISVHSFSKESLDILQKQFLSFEIATTINSDSKGSRLYVLKKSYLNFKKITSPYIVKCMERKLP